MNVDKDKVVTFTYTLTNDKGEVLDSSQAHGPLSYLHGHGAIIPGLEAEMAGKSGGDSFQAKIAPADAYGEYNEELIIDVPKDRFPEPENIEKGMQFQAQTQQGMQVFTVEEVKDEVVSVDGNHPLAGENLSFDVEITDIRDATSEEIEHGHVHQEGDEHHE